MHMISIKDLSDAEMDTLTKSCSPTIVITANGEVQTHEEAIVYVKELDIFLTMKVLDNTSQQYCRSESFAMKTGIPTNGSMVKKPHLIKDGIRIICNTEKLRSYHGSRLVKFFLCIFINFTDTYETGESFFFILFILTFFSYSRRNCRFEKGKM